MQERLERGNSRRRACGIAGAIDRNLVQYDTHKLGDNRAGRRCTAKTARLRRQLHRVLCIHSVPAALLCRFHAC